MIDDVVLNFSANSVLALNAVLAIVMFSIAIDLLPQDFKSIFRAPKALIVGLLSQFLLLPALTFALLLVANPAPSVALGLILVAACPGGNISNFITHRAGGNSALSVSMTALATVGAIFLTPLNIAFWGNLYAPTRAILRSTQIDPVSVAITVGFMLVLPLALGVWLNHSKPNITQKIRGPLKWISTFIFAAFVVAAIGGNWGNFVQLAFVIITLVIVHNALGLAGGYSIATLAGLSEYDRRAITIETGIQNSGLGLVLTFSFFGGLGGMAVVAAFWGIWHALSGIALAALMSRTIAQR